MREALPRPDEKSRREERDRDALCAVYDAGSFDRERQSRIEQKPHEGLTQRTAWHSKPPRDERKDSAKDQPVKESLDAHVENLLRLCKCPHRDRGRPAGTIDLKAVAAGPFDVDSRREIAPPLI